jgi:hypothetical protein
LKNGEIQIASTPRLGDVVQLVDDARQIADAVAVGVHGSCAGRSGR